MHKQFPLVCRRINLNVLAESIFVVETLAQKAGAPIGVFIKIVTGYHRTGLTPDRLHEIDNNLSVVLSGFPKRR
jgi:D-serine deaminase-like pyridoxal phosphate-dependent protein